MAKDTLIVGDIRLYREGLAQVLRDQPYIAVVGTASDPESAIRKVADLLPEVVLLDTAMPKALQTARRIRAIAPDASIIALGPSCCGHWAGSSKLPWNGKRAKPLVPTGLRPAASQRRSEHSCPDRRAAR